MNYKKKMYITKHFLLLHVFIGSAIFTLRTYRDFLLVILRALAVSVIQEVLWEQM